MTSGRQIYSCFNCTLFTKLSSEIYSRQGIQYYSQQSKIDFKCCASCFRVIFEERLFCSSYMAIIFLLNVLRPLYYLKIFFQYRKPIIWLAIPVTKFF